MTAREVQALVNAMSATWPHATRIPADALPIWLADLGDLRAEDVAAAFTYYRRSGHEFPPTSGQLRALVLELADPGQTFEQVWGEIQRAVGLWGSYREEEATDAISGEANSLVQAMGGWSAVCSGGPSGEKPIDPGVWYSQARNAWAAMRSQRAQDMAAIGLPGRRGESAGKRLLGEIGWAPKLIEGKA